MAQQENTVPTKNTGDQVTAAEFMDVVDTQNANAVDAESRFPEKNELFTLDATDITNKYVDIVGTITNTSSIKVFVDNIGLKMEVGVDYEMISNRVSWVGLELENLLELSDKLNIYYF